MRENARQVERTRSPTIFPSIEPYLDRIGVRAIDEATLDSLKRLQRAHIGAVPFENLAIVGDPVGPYEPEGVSLTIEALYEKLVRRHRGGYCFELNGLFAWLLAELGYHVDRLPARVGDGDGEDMPPANHHTIAVQLDRRYLIDVGTGLPKPRQPVPFDGTTETIDAIWRIRGTDRPDLPYALEYQSDDTSSWSIRYRFRDDPVDLGYFRATNDYLQLSPESPFTGKAMVNLATPDGYLRCTPDTFEVLKADTSLEHELDPSRWRAILALYFDLAIPG